MIITEHPPVTMGGKTTYTVHVETEEDADRLREMEAEGISVGQFSSAFNKGKDYADDNDTRGK